jgi:hypothetical protein
MDFSPTHRGFKCSCRDSPQLAEIGSPKQTPGHRASPAAGAKAHLFDEVRADLEAITATARTIAKKEPGFSAPYRLGDDTQSQTLADATRVLKELENPATVAKFIAYSIDPGFVDDLVADLALIDDKGNEQEEDPIDSVGETTRIRALIVEARALLKSLHTSATNRFRRDPEILAEWATASHIHRTPRGPKPHDAPPPAPAP